MERRKKARATRRPKQTRSQISNQGYLIFKTLRDRHLRKGASLAIDVNANARYMNTNQSTEADLALANVRLVRDIV